MPGNFDPKPGLSALTDSSVFDDDTVLVTKIPMRSRPNFLDFYLGLTVRHPTPTSGEWKVAYHP